MRKIMLFLALMAMLAACDDGVEKAYWENGNLKSELRYANGKLNGECVWYYQNGNKMSKGYYVDDVLEGCFMRWHPNGNIA